MTFQLASLAGAVLGGALIGSAAGVLMLFNGRIAGISGLIDGVLDRERPHRGEDLLFLAGLPLGAILFQGVGGEIRIDLTASPLWLLIGGLLVGFGTRLGHGCTSGHGVCGLARLSRRSLVATLLFMAAAIATVAVRNGLS